MEIDEIMTFDGEPYRVVEVLHKTMYSTNQKFVSATHKRVEPRRTFYVVERDGKTYWVKEYTDPKFGYGIQYEYDETKRLSKSVITDRGTISAVKMLAISGKRLLVEHLEGYVKFSSMKANKISPAVRKGLRKLLRAWVDGTDVHDYDMCGNNTMILDADGVLSVKLLDFEHSGSWNEERWNGFIQSI